MFNIDALKSIMKFYLQSFIYLLRIYMFTTAVRVLPADWCFPLGNVEKLQKASDHDWDEKVMMIWKIWGIKTVLINMFILKGWVGGLVDLTSVYLYFSILIWNPLKRKPQPINTASFPKLVYNWLCFCCKANSDSSQLDVILESFLKIGFWGHFTWVWIRLSSPSEAVYKL